MCIRDRCRPGGGPPKPGEVFSLFPGAAAAAFSGLSPGAIENQDRGGEERRLSQLSESIGGSQPGSCLLYTSRCV